MAIPYYNDFGGPGSPAPREGEIYVFQHTKKGGFVVEMWAAGTARPVQQGPEYKTKAEAEAAAQTLVDAKNNNIVNVETEAKGSLDTKGAGTDKGSKGAG